MYVCVCVHILYNYVYIHMCMYLYMHKLLDITSLSRIFMSHPSPIRVLLDKCQELSHMPHGRHLSAGKGQGEPLKC